MKTIIIDGNDFSDLAAFYDEIEMKFTNFHGQMGRNLDALNDVMSGGFGVTELREPIKIIWKNSEKSKLDLGYNAQALYYKPDESRKAETNQHNPQRFATLQEKYEKALRHEGPTAFDDIFEVIKGHSEHIELELR